MSRLRTENLKMKLKEAICSVRQRWESANKRSQHLIMAVIVPFAMFTVYALSKGEEAAKTKVLTAREGEFKKSRILGDPYAASGRAKEQLLSKTAKEYSETQKMLLDGLTQINSRIDSIERKVAGEGVKNTTETDAGSVIAAQSGQGDPVAAPHSDGLSVQPTQPSQGQTSRDPIDMRPNIPVGNGSYGYSRFGNRDYEEIKLKPTKGPPVISFPVQGAAIRDRAEVVLPVGSYVKAKLLTGVEAPEGNPYPVLMQLDFANILPNKKSLDLRGCFMIAKAQGDLSTERVQMQATKLSCVSKSGQMFERDINGFVADAVDNSFAVIGTVNTKQDRVAAMAFLSSVVEGVGKAIQMAQTSEQTSSDGSSKTTLTGNQGKYIAAGGAGTAAGMVAQWYLKQAQSLLPTINVGSGQDVWVVMNETVALPHEYFKKVSQGESHGNDYSLVNRLFD
jgi:conjugal transfer pilus assembly protein TraB